MGENVSHGAVSPKQCVDAWLKSPSHRAKILDSRYTHMGVGHALIPGSEYGHYYTQVFGIAQ